MHSMLCESRQLNLPLYDLVGHGPSNMHDKDVKRPVGISSLPAVQNKLAVATKVTTSGSSRDLSDDEEAEEETGMTENMDPTDVKRARR